jgi:hypothetical protein
MTKELAILVEGRDAARLRTYEYSSVMEVALRYIRIRAVGSEVAALSCVMLSIMFRKRSQEDWQAQLLSRMRTSHLSMPRATYPRR